MIEAFVGILGAGALVAAVLLPSLLVEHRRRRALVDPSWRRQMSGLTRATGSPHIEEGPRTPGHP